MPINERSIRVTNTLEQVDYFLQKGRMGTFVFLLLISTALLPGDFAQAGKITELQAQAKQGIAEAQHDLGLLYHEGRGVPQNHRKAVTWFRKAANQGYAKARFNLAVMYEHGRGVPQDYQEATKWYHKAADQGDARAQFNLGSLYYEGHGVVQDYVQAHKWLSLAEGHFTGTDQVRAAQTRDMVEAQMAPAQIAEAQERMLDWRQKTE